MKDRLFCPLMEGGRHQIDAAQLIGPVPRFLPKLCIQVPHLLT